MSDRIELASVVIGPFDDVQDFYIYQGYVWNESYIFSLTKVSYGYGMYTKLLTQITYILMEIPEE